jgi:serine protease AprX
MYTLALSLWKCESFEVLFSPEAIQEVIIMVDHDEKTAKSPSQGRCDLRAGVLSEAFFEQDTEERERLGLPANINDENESMSMVVELNLFHEGGLEGSRKKFWEIFREKTEQDPEQQLVKIADTYVRCELTIKQIKELVDVDQQVDTKKRSIYRVWPDFNMRLLIDRSVTTIKADAARRSFDAAGSDLIWAVIDSGIDGNHPHFHPYETLKGSVENLHRDFTKGEETTEGALVDEDGHGTHVAGIIAGGLSTDPDIKFLVGQRVATSQESKLEKIEERKDCDRARLIGVAPRCKLISLKVKNANSGIRSTDVLRALEYVRVKLNGHGKPPLRVHGVNISLGYDFNARWFACGQSPVCIEVDRLVRSGVVVVVAAGNTGYGDLSTPSGRTSTGMALTINDPGNANLAITVGSTHRDSPHTYGVSYFSSKGPTGDGRAKPDLIAPGERITSCAAGKFLTRLKSELSEKEDFWGSDGPYAAYIDESGTSMAAPHVSGAIADFLSIRREFIGQPEEVKRIFLATATSLGREKYFEGRGLVDLMRAIQSI